VNEFVEECRREWRRLRVPDPVANEMAADLTADLDEAESEGGPAEDVLGNSAFDPRRFAAAWAVARGVAGPPAPDRLSGWRRPLALGLSVFLGALTILAGLVLLSGHASSSIAVATRRIVAGPGPIGFFAPGPGGMVVPGPFGPFDVRQISHGHPIALVVLAVGLVGLGLLAALYWSPWFRRRRYERHGRAPGWN